MTGPMLDATGQVPSSLRRVVDDYGPACLDDATLLGRMLPDLLAGLQREANLVLAAAGAGTARFLAERVDQGLPVEAAIRDASAHLAAVSPLDRTACEWIAAAYADALGLPAGRTVVAATDDPATVVQPGPDPLPLTRPTPVTSPMPPVETTIDKPTPLPADRPGAGAWALRYALPGAALAATNLATVVLVARVEVGVGTQLGPATLWWLCAFAPLAIAVVIRVRTRPARGWLDTTVAVLATVATFLVIVQALDPHRHYVTSVGLAVSDGAAVAILGYLWFDRTEIWWARATAAGVAALATWLIQRSATQLLAEPSNDHWRRTVVQGLLVPALLVAASLVSWLISRRRPA